MSKKIISIILSVVILTMCASTVFAAGFSDVTEEGYPWAYTQINEMSQKAIINGYPDGTFKPENGITKLEAMLLIARSLGLNESVYSDLYSKIYGIYKEELKSLPIDYKAETAFLIFKGVFSVDEIKDIYNNNEENDPLHRYEVAEYLARAMGVYGTLNDSDTGYSDENIIPDSSRPYVKYVKDEGLMLGMDASNFVPDYEVTRAQMAVILYRIINKQNYMFVSGTFESYDSKKKQINVNVNSQTGSYDSTNADYIFNGEEVDIDDFKKGNDIILVFENSVLKKAEMIYVAPDVSKIVQGQVKEVTLTSTKSIKVNNSVTGVVESYIFANNCEVKVGINSGTLSVIRLNDNANLYIDENGLVFKVEIVEINDRFNSGIVKEISSDDSLAVIQIEQDDIVSEYSISEDVIIKRNGKEAVLNDILSGDKITLCETEYNIITRLEVKSEIGSSKGTISAIYISSKSSITLLNNDVEKEYPITNNIVVTLDGKACEIYDLRLGMTASVTTDSGAVSAIEVATVDEVGQISGTIELVNISYGFINVKLTSGDTKQVFVTSSTKITADGATTATKTIKNLKVGDYVVIIGKNVNGAFQATTIVIVD